MKFISKIIIVVLVFLCGAAAGGSYVLHNLDIKENSSQYIVNYEHHQIIYDKVD